MSRAAQKLLTRQRIIEASGRVFRKCGFGGIGVDGLAKEAGVTSGAFYVHFPSKANAFQAAVSDGMAGLRIGIQHFQALHGQDWWPAFVHYYLDEKRQCDLAQSCGLPSLAPEVISAGTEAKELFEAELLATAQLIVEGPASMDKPVTRETALSALATLIGAITLARAITTPEIADSLARTAYAALLPGSAQQSPPVTHPAV